jgi:fatty acid synthase, animal type
LKEISALPRLFTFSAKTQEGLEKIMAEIRLNPIDMAHQFLMPEATKQFTVDYFRGFCILNSDKTIQKIEQIKKEETRPVWYIFSGLNAEWFRSYNDMMKIESFYYSIKQSAEYLKPYGFDLIEFLRLSNTEQFEKKYGQTLYAFVAITAIQMALIDCLYQAGVKADGLIGHSIGELACAYADKALTAEETILTAYWRGKVIEDAKLPAGAMAVVGLSWEQAQKRCPVGVVPACYNHDENVTVSGPLNLVQQFVHQLTTEGMFNFYQIAYF